MGERSENRPNASEERSDRALSASDLGTRFCPAKALAEGDEGEARNAKRLEGR